MLLSGKFVFFPFTYEQDCSRRQIVDLGWLGKASKRFYPRDNGHVTH